jgi:hypothetical protein
VGAPEVIILGIVALVAVAAVLAQRHKTLQMLHSERLAALEKGAVVPVAVPPPTAPRVYLLRGLIWSGIGLSVLFCLFALALSSHRPAPAETRMWRAHNIHQSSGIPMDQAMLMVEQDENSHLQGMPVSVALFGLIPLFVGLAYLIFYYTDESRNVRPSEPAPPRSGLNLT